MGIQNVNSYKNNKFLILIIAIVIVIVSLFLVMFNWNFICSQSAGIQAITTFVLVIITAYYSYYTFSMSLVMKQELESKSVPDIAIRFKKKDASLYFLELENISNVDIFNLKFIEYPNLPISENKKTSNIGFIKNGISYFGRGQKYDSLFLNFSWIIEEKKMDDVFSIKIEYSDKNKKKYCKSFDFNINLFRETMPETTLIGELKNINKNLVIITESMEKTYNAEYENNED
ncbi:MAG TPA: hypothetical protein PLP37_01235 [Clostridiales bacterium]|nr:hypothetical protein [Clostridiales bacterium]